MNREGAYSRIDAIIAKYEIDEEYVTITSALDYDALRMARKALEQQSCGDAISRQAALNSLIDNTHLDGYDLAEALDAIENKEKLPPVTQKSGEWIPVSKKLPELKQRVLVSYETMDDGKKVDITIHDKHGFLISGAYAWMPLPKPYEPQESEK